MRGLGYRRDAHDARDRLFGAHHASLGSIPASASVDDAHVFAKDQGETSSCVGQSWSQALRLAYLAKGVACPELSALFVYRLARNVDGTSGDEGSQLRSGARAVMDLGCATEAAWPFSEKAVNDQPTFAADHSAFDRSGKRRYYRISAGDTDSVKRALAAGLPVVGGFDVDEDFVSGDGRSLVDVQNRSKLAGGHALAIVSYDGDEFGILNSWGSSYGYSGRFHATTGFVASGSDLWALSIEGGIS